REGKKAVQEAFEQSKQAIDAFNALPERSRKEVREATAGSILSDSKRNLPFTERKVKQQEKFQLPLLPTTTIGSFPQTAEVRRTRTKWRRGEITDQQYQTFIEAEISKWIEIQEELDLDVL